MNSSQIIQKNIRYLRTTLGITQEQLAFISGLPSACGYVAAMLGGGSFAGDVLASYVIKTGIVMYLICGFFATGIGRYLKRRIMQLNTNIVYIIEPMLTIGFLLISTAFLVGGGNSSMNLFVR